VNRDGVDRRAAVLLDAHRAELPFRLRQAVRLAASHERPIDWRRLLADLLRWEHPRRPVQKAWARSYFGDAR
jgi:CRISPR system Cascade subunit CasB